MGCLPSYLTSVGASLECVLKRVYMRTRWQAWKSLSEHWFESGGRSTGYCHLQEAFHSGLCLCWVLFTLGKMVPSIQWLVCLLTWDIDLLLEDFESALHPSPVFTGSVWGAASGAKWVTRAHVSPSAILRCPVIPVWVQSNNRLQSSKTNMWTNTIELLWRDEFGPPQKWSTWDDGISSKALGSS